LPLFSDNGFSNSLGVTMTPRGSLTFFGEEPNSDEEDAINDKYAALQ